MLQLLSEKVHFLNQCFHLQQNTSWYSCLTGNHVPTVLVNAVSVLQYGVIFPNALRGWLPHQISPICRDSTDTQHKIAQNLNLHGLNMD